MQEQFKILHGSCLDLMKTMDDNSIDSIVTDPPYELGFMGKSWDSSGIAYNVDVWKEALRVLKPGGFMLAFSGSRTYHRMVCAIEDAGFEIRDQIMWVYGSGFPKSLNISKAIDKAAGAEREITRIGQTKAPEDAGKFDSAFSAERERRDFPATDEAKQWDGWGTALKPAHEPICVARKPIDGTVANNILMYGTGGLNIDGCRVELNGDYKCKANGRPSQTGLDDGYDASKANQVDTVGRWPANFIHDGSDEVIELFPKSIARPGLVGSGNNKTSGKGWGIKGIVQSAYQDTETSAARFFYCAKASKKDREVGNDHPTVKPTDLMRYLCRLVTPPGGIVLDLFNGSGSTGKAAVLEGFKYIGCELSKEYIDISIARIQAAIDGSVSTTKVPNKVKVDVQSEIKPESSNNLLSFFN